MDDNLQDMIHRSGRSKIPMDLTLAEALRFSWSNRRAFGRFMIIPVAVATLLELASLAFYEGSDQTASRMIWSFGVFLPDFLVLTWFAVACHRFILIGTGAISAFGLIRWTWRETRFFLWMLLAYALGYLFMMFCMAVLPLGAIFVVKACGFTTKTMSLMMEHPAFIPGVFLLASIPFAYVVGRVSLLLPATAIDLRPSFSSAWDSSEGNGWRVALLVGGIPVAFMAIQSLIWMGPSWVFGESLQETQADLDGTSIGLTFGQSILRYTFATVEIAILSITFRRLRTMDEQKSASPPST